MTSGIQSYTKINDETVQITTKTPDSHLPSDLTTLYFASPTAVEKEGNTGFGLKPVGTGPFKFVSETTGQELVLGPNEHYWAGAPKLTKLILKPIPDPTARIAALRSGEVNWIEYPTPDDIYSLKRAGYQIKQNTYDHIWPWIFEPRRSPGTTSRSARRPTTPSTGRQWPPTCCTGRLYRPYQLIPQANCGLQRLELHLQL